MKEPVAGTPKLPHRDFESAWCNKCIQDGSPPYRGYNFRGGAQAQHSAHSNVMVPVSQSSQGDCTVGKQNGRETLEQCQVESFANRRDQEAQRCGYQKRFPMIDNDHVFALMNEQCGTECLCHKCGSSPPNNPGHTNRYHAKRNEECGCQHQAPLVIRIPMMGNQDSNSV